MTDETKQPTDEEIKAVAEATHRPDEYPEGQAEEAKERIAEQDSVDAADAATVAVLETTEKLSETPAAQGWDKAVSGIEQALENIADSPRTDHHESHDVHGDTTVIKFRGREYTFPVPIYTAVFFVLAALTVIEVVLAEIIASDVKVPILVAISLCKAGLVVWFYMHLNRDARIFALTLLLPVLVGMLSMLYLLAVPTGYSY